jgi:hypothetical protein
MTTDEVIRQAFERQAEKAPPADRVLADLRMRMSRARRRRVATQSVMAVVFSGAAVAAAAVWVPSGGPESIGHRVQAGPRPAPVRLLYRPGWVPRGFTEVAREVGQGRSNSVQIRTWADRSLTERPVDNALVPRVDVGVEPPTQGGREDRLTSLRRQSGTSTVDVNGHEARRWLDGARCEIAWRPTAQAVLSVTLNGLIDPCADALRVARSVGPDDRATVVPPLRATWLPAGYATDHVVVSRTDSGCRAELVATSALRSISAEVGAGRLPAQGTPLRIGGRPARSYHIDAVSTTGEPSGGMAVAVDLGGGRLLTVRDYEEDQGLSPGALGQVAAGVDVGDTAGACTW